MTAALLGVPDIGRATLTLQIPIIMIFLPRQYDRSQKGRDGAFAQAVPASWNDFLLLLADSYWSFRSQLRHLLQEAFSALSHPTGQAPPLGSPGPWGSSVTAPTTPDWTVC